MHPFMPLFTTISPSYCFVVVCRRREDEVEVERPELREQERWVCCVRARVAVPRPADRGRGRGTVENPRVVRHRLGLLRLCLRRAF